MAEVLRVVWTLLNVLFAVLLLGGFVLALWWLNRIVELGRSNQAILRQILEELKKKGS